MERNSKEMKDVGWKRHKMGDGRKRGEKLVWRVERDQDGGGEGGIWWRRERAKGWRSREGHLDGG
jgi:hypothetical protein